MSQASAVLKSIAGEAVPLQGVSARGSVNGLLFELEVTQRYRNESPRNIEAVYTFPLPHGAVVLDLEVELGDRRLVGCVIEKQDAEQRYEQAVEDGDAAVLLQLAASGLCTVALGNLSSGESARIRYRYAQLLRFEQGSVRLTVPTVIAPRYGDAHAAGLQPHQVPQHDLVVSYPFDLAIRLDGVVAQGRITSPSHAIATKHLDSSIDLTLAKPAALDRDFVLTIDGLAERSLAVVTRDGEGYVALASVCAELPCSTPEAPLRLKLLVDCSGSMAGDSIAAAKRALHRILAALTPSDRFTYSRFGRTIAHDVPSLTAADAFAVRRASQCIAETDANLGGTEMAAALRSVFGLGGSRDAADVLLLTDGEIWNADDLIVEAQRAHQRVFVVGIGAAPAEGVLRRLAEATGGACELVAPGEDAEAAIVRMFARLRAPRVQRTGIAWPTQPAWTVEPTAALFGGETIHAWAGFDVAPHGRAGLLLVPSDEGPALETFVMLPEAVDQPALARLAAASRLPALEPDAQLALALRYSLLTSRTSFIVVHERAAGQKAEGMPALRTVPNMVAAGWGGLGTVREDSPATVMHAVRSAPALSTPTPRHAPATPKMREEASSARLWPVIRELNKMVSAFGRERLPRIFEELIRYRVPSDVIDALRALVAEGYTEDEIVRAFLEALRPLAIRFNASRALVRTLRKDFTWNGRRRALQQRMAAIVAAALGDEDDGRASVA